MKLKILIGTILIANAANANPLQIREAKEHLEYLSERRGEAREDYKAKLRAYKSIDDAYDTQKSVVSKLEKAYEKKLEAEKDAVEAAKVVESHNPYLMDKDHATGGVTSYNKVNNKGYDYYYGGNK